MELQDVLTIECYRRQICDNIVIISPVFCRRPIRYNILSVDSTSELSSRTILRLNMRFCLPFEHFKNTNNIIYVTNIHQVVKKFRVLESCQVIPLSNYIVSNFLLSLSIYRIACFQPTSDINIRKLTNLCFSCVILDYDHITA